MQMCTIENGFLNHGESPWPIYIWKKKKNPSFVNRSSPPWNFFFFSSPRFVVYFFLLLWNMFKKEWGQMLRYASTWTGNKDAPPPPLTSSVPKGSFSLLSIDAYRFRFYSGQSQNVYLGPKLKWKGCGNVNEWTAITTRILIHHGATHVNLETILINSS